MKVTVELFGIPRARAGTAHTSATGTTLGDILVDLATRYPGLAESCIDGRELKPGFTVNLNGQRFASASETPLSDVTTVMLLSLDAGG